MSIKAAIIVVFNIEPHKKSVKGLLRIQDDPRGLFFGCPKQFRIGAWIGKRHREKKRAGLPAFFRSLDSGRGALVDAGAAVDAFGSIDDGDVVNGDRIVGARIGADAAAHALGLFDCNHFDYL